MNLVKNFSVPLTLSCLIILIFMIFSCINCWAMYEEQEVSPQGNQRMTSGSLAEKKDEIEEEKEGKDKKTSSVISKGYSGPEWGLLNHEIEYLFENCRDFVCIIEFGGHLKRINKAWKDALGWEINELLETPYITFVHPDDVEKTLEYEKKFTPTGLINRYQCKDGSYCWIDWIGLSKVKEEQVNTETAYPLTIGRNVTFREELEQSKHRKELEVQETKREQAEDTSLSKTNFLAHMSHEIRTPLTGLLGMLDLINKSSLPEEDLEYLDLAYGSGLSLLSLLNDILDISKIEAKQVKLETIQFNPTIVAQEVVHLLAFEAKKKEIELKLTVSAHLPTFLIGDPTRFRQILFNLIGNGVKFTSKGKVSVLLSGNKDNGNFILIGDVKDTGIGISLAMQEKLFVPFSQGDSSMLRRFGGTGLGLFITTSLCEMMGGNIKIVKSKEGKGSTFRFMMKLARSEASISPREPSVTLPNKLPNIRVLVAEDNALNQLILSSMLKKAGCSVFTAWNGKEAVEAVSNETYDLVLMDGEMPVMDGLEATQKIRKIFSANTLPIIGVTAHAMIEDRDRFLNAGMNGYLTKPIQKDGLFAEILKCLALKTYL